MRRIILTLFTICGLTIAAQATVIVPADLPELSRDARAIARGHVLRVDARWTEDRRTVETIVTLGAERYLKGDLGEVVQFRVPGGTLGRYRNIVIGSPQFAVGDRVIVFLGTAGPRVPHVLGMGQGVYRIGADARGETVVTPPSIASGVVGPIVRGIATRRPAPLASFESDVLALAQGAR